MSLSNSKDRWNSKTIENATRSLLDAIKVADVAEMGFMVRKERQMPDLVPV
jgi:hypothetical protein